ncbi:MAG TPA: SprB repeat-containing protein [Bacteroidia bacterium]|nr:SprB repeat-containing protein [Bacteroidia bacterium]
MKKLFASLVLILAASVALAQLNISFTASSHNGYHISCNRGNDGWITANATGGFPPYTYLWSNLATTQTISNLTASYYAVTVTDGLGATATNGLNLSEPQLLAVLLSSYLYPNGYNVSCYQCFNGSITNNTSGGVSPYTYSWVDGPTTQNRTSVGGSILYKVTVTDANGCTAMRDITLTEPERNDWTMTGNTGSNPATHYIGTADNVDLVLRTNGTERMRVNTNGNVNVSGNLSSSTINVSGASTYNIMHIIDSIEIGNSIWLGGQNQNTASDNRIYTDDGPLIIQEPAQFNVGLGSFSKTFPPKAKVEILDGKFADYFSTQLPPQSITSPYCKPVFQVTYSSDPDYNCPEGYVFKVVDYPNLTTAFFAEYNPNPNTATEPGAPSPTTFGILNNGKVVIGTDYSTTNYNYKLAVNGNIICEEVKVKLRSSWPDNVFENNYQCMSLKELENFIKENKHLPGIASADEVKNNDGVEIGDMQMKLLQKIEELTLYIIEQQKQIDELKEQVKK